MIRKSALVPSTVIALLVAACGTDAGSSTTTAVGGSEATSRAVCEGLTVLFPVDSPNMYGFRVADAQGYFNEEGLEVSLELVDGSGTVIQQLLAGNGQIGSVGTGTVAEALEEGHDNVRAIGNTNYGSVFLL